MIVPGVFLTRRCIFLEAAVAALSQDDVSSVRERCRGESLGDLRGFKDILSPDLDIQYYWKIGMP